MNAHWRTIVLTLIVTAMSALLTNAGLAQEGEDPAHDEIRTMRDDAIAAFEEGDLDRLLTHVHPNVVVTWQNAEVSRGHDGVREFYERMMQGDDSEVESLTASLEVDELSILYGGDTAIAFGHLAESFQLRSGFDFDLDNRWSATLVRDDEQWLIAGFHVSTNMFENGLQDLLLKENTLKSGGIGLAVGMLLGAVVTALIGRWRRKAENSTPETEPSPA